MQTIPRRWTETSPQIQEVDYYSCPSCRTIIIEKIDNKITIFFCAIDNNHYSIWMKKNIPLQETWSVVPFHVVEHVPVPHLITISIFSNMNCSLGLVAIQTEKWAFSEELGGRDELYEDDFTGELCSREEFHLQNTGNFVVQTNSMPMPLQKNFLFAEEDWPQWYPCCRACVLDRCLTHNTTSPPPSTSSTYSTKDLNYTTPFVAPWYAFIEMSSLYQKTLWQKVDPCRPRVRNRAMR